MVVVLCRGSSVSAELSSVPDEEEEMGSPGSTDPTNDAEGTVTWQQATTATTKKGQKKKKSEGVFVSVRAQCLTSLRNPVLFMKSDLPSVYI